jgi:carbamoyltransferase
LAQWIAAITRGHNGGVCLLKDGEIVFAIEEERLSRTKYDGGPLASMTKILDYTNRLDYLVVAHTQSLEETAGKIDFTQDDIYTGFARKLGLISKTDNPHLPHPQVIDLSHVHHRLHAACAFYRSGFESATAVIVDGAGSFLPMKIGSGVEMTYELESVFSCAYPNNIRTIYKHQGGRGPWPGFRFQEYYDERNNEIYELIIDDAAGIVKAYEAVTQYCGFNPIEAGKTMGLFPYGQPNDKIPSIYSDGGSGHWRTTDRNLIIPTYPNGAVVNEGRYPELETDYSSISNSDDLTRMQNRRDLAYAVQTQSQQEVLDLILASVKRTGIPNVVLSGGYGLNCVANYYYLKTLNEHGIKLYVEPISSDAGTAIGAALMIYHDLTGSEKIRSRDHTLYLGFQYDLSEQEIKNTAEKYQAAVTTGITNKDIIDLIRGPNIVAIFQGRSENGPRALGNRSILFDPTVLDGKDHVNKVKRREYFRPFAGTILAEHANEWFDMRGLESSPHMMYAMNCQPGVESKIPAIIHVDGTCRIQTVSHEQNPHYYDLIREFYDQTGVPIIFNTSFNLGGEPLVETLDDAVRTLANSEIEYLYLPEYQTLITLKNQGE